jgi:hypothetical protein
MSLRMKLLMKGTNAAETGTAKATRANAKRKLNGLMPNAVK